MDSLQFKLLNDFQRRFPLVSRPYEVLARRCMTTEAHVLAQLCELALSGAISRVGAAFAPNRIGASTLFALSVPAHQLAATAAIVGRLPEVNHNYEREHRYNLWAVATAPDEGALANVLDAVRKCTGAPMLDLRLMEEYRIDLGFDLTGRPSAPDDVTLNGPRLTLQPAERKLVQALQHGLPLVQAPFKVLAERIGTTEAYVLSALSRWVASGVIRRFGVIVRHRELGYRANAMAVWDVPDELVSTRGRAIAAAPGVTLAYRRRRSLPDWPYNLFCMVHGKARETVEATVAGIGRRLDLGDYPHAMLFSQRRFKQTGARYVPQETTVAYG